MSQRTPTHKYTIEFDQSLWTNLVDVAGHGNIKQFIIQALTVALEAYTVKAIILCGGKGTGFRPFSIATPPVMLPIGYKPIIEYSIDLLRKHALTDIFLAVGYLREHIRTQFSEHTIPEVNMRYVIEDKPLDTAGALLNVKAQHKSKFQTTFLVMNGDLVTNCNLTELLKFHRAVVDKSGVGSMFILKTEQGGQVEIGDEDEQVVRFAAGGKKNYTLTNAGIYVFEPEIFSYIEKDVSSLEKDVFPALAKDGVLYGYVPDTPVYWNHINSLEKYTQGWADFLAGKLNF
ncbi:MAG: NDP-sugar synthase [Candidatus Thorarchaeota archaeon]